MPVNKWQIEPTRLISPASFGNQNGYRGTELTDAINASMSSIIVQLSCLAHHAEMMFGELIHDSQQLVNRANNLNGRVTVLKQFVTELNPVVEEVSLDQVSMNRPYKSASSRELSLADRPEAITLQYRNAAPPPALQKLNAYRDDGKDCLKSYTNPDFFFELWCRQIQQEVEQKKKVVRKRQPKKKPDENIVVKVQRKIHDGSDVEFRSNKPSVLPRKPSVSTEKESANLPGSEKGGNVVLRASGRTSSTTSTGGDLPPPPPLARKPTSVSSGNQPSRPAPSPPFNRGLSEALPTPPPTPMPPKPVPPAPRDNLANEDDDPPPPPVIVRSAGGGGRQNRLSRISMPPPPPISVCFLDSTGDDDRMSTLQEEDFPLPPPGPAVSGATSRPTAPPPPQPPSAPPPPPPMLAAPAPPPPPPPPPPPENNFAAPPPPPMESGFGLRSVPTASGGSTSAVKRQETQKRASRGDLLKAIRDGMKLRNVEERKQEKDVKPSSSSGGGVGGLFDVSKILEIRRLALENDDDSEVEDDEDWED